MVEETQRPMSDSSPGPSVPVNDLVRHTRSIRKVVDQAIGGVLDSGWFVLGPRVTEFEGALAALCGTGEAVGVANGTDAIEIALRALDIGPGDEVITVANAGGYSTTAIRAVGAQPVYVDIDPTTLQIDPLLASQAQGPNTAAVVVTHLYGRMAPVDRVVAAAGSIPIIEDCAQAHGANLGGRSAGGWGTLGCFSFYPTKNLGALGDGGAIVGSDGGLMARVRRLRQYGWGGKYLTADSGGRNSRLDELQAAVLTVQLPLLSEWNRRRREIDAAYRAGIDHPAVRPIPLGHGDVVHLAVCVADNRSSLRSHLHEVGVITDIHYPQPDYAAPPGGFAPLPQTEDACNRVLTLPCFPEMTDAEVDRVIAGVNSWRT